MRSKDLGLQLLRATHDAGLQARIHGLSCSGGSSTIVGLHLPPLEVQLETLLSARTSTILDLLHPMFASDARKNPEELDVRGLYYDWVVRDHLGSPLIRVVNHCRDNRLIYDLYFPH